MIHYDVVGIGEPCVDLLINVDHMPVDNEFVEMNKHSWQGGGKVATAVVALSRLGSKVGFVGKIGNDSFGSFIVEDFKRHGVNISNLTIKKNKQTRFSLVISDKENNNRNIIYNKGDVAPLKIENVNIDYMLDSKIIHISGGTEIDKNIIKIAKNNDIKVSIDADHYNENVLEMIPMIDYFIASKMFLDQYSNNLESGLKKISTLGPEIVIVTLGEKGCASYYKGEVNYYSGFKVDVVDTTGAGDVFHGAFLHGLIEGMNIDDCCKFANAVSALKCTKIGGRAGIPRMNEVEIFLKSGEITLNDAGSLLKTYSDFNYK